MVSANVYLHDWYNCSTNSFRNLMYEAAVLLISVLKFGLLPAPVPQPHTTVGTRVVISGMNYL